MSDQRITEKIAALDLNTKQGIEQANSILAPYIHEKASLDLKTAIHQLEIEEDPLKRYPLLDEVEKAYKAIANAQRDLDQPMPTLQEAPLREATDDYEPEFLIDGWMPANRLTMLTGPGGTGKSYLALQHVCGLAMGITDHFLEGYHGSYEEMYSDKPNAFRKDPIKVVIASYEEDLAETWKRIALICDTLGWADYDKLRERIRFVDLKMFGPIWGVGQDTHMAIRAKLLEIGDWLLSECKSFKARLLMLDPSAGAYGSSEIARESVREFCSYLNGWGQQVNCATLLIAHPNKTGDDYSGSTDWLGSCRAMWTLRVEQEQNKQHWYQLTNVKQNYASPQRCVYLRKIQQATGDWTPIWEECSQEDAEAFYKAYRDPQSTRTQEDTHDDYASIPDDEIVF